MEIIKTVEYTIGKHFISAIYYCDTSGLNDEDTKAVNEFIEKIGLGTVEIIENSDDFRYCEICNLKADTIDINVHYFKNEAV